MKAIVLAAGYGTRLYPLTKDVPKPLIKVGGKPIIEHILQCIDEIPVDEIIIVSNNRFFINFQEWLKSYFNKAKIKLLNDFTDTNEDRLGAVGDIDFAVKHAKIDDDVLVIAGDNLFDFSLSEMYRFFKVKNASVVALHDLVDRSKVAGKFGSAIVNHELEVVDFEEKPQVPKSSLASTACYFFTRKDISLLEKCIQEHKKPDNLGDFIRWLAAREHVYGFIFREKWFDIGSHEQLKEADEHWSSK